MHLGGKIGLGRKGRLKVMVVLGGIVGPVWQVHVPIYGTSFYTSPVITVGVRGEVVPAQGEVAPAQGEVAQGEVAQGEVVQGEVAQGEVTQGEVAQSCRRRLAVFRGITSTV